MKKTILSITASALFIMQSASTMQQGNSISSSLASLKIPSAPVPSTSLGANVPPPPPPAALLPTTEQYTSPERVISEIESLIHKEYENSGLHICARAVYHYILGNNDLIRRGLSKGSRILDGLLEEVEEKCKKLDEELGVLKATKTSKRQEEWRQYEIAIQKLKPFTEQFTRVYALLGEIRATINSKRALGPDLFEQAYNSAKNIENKYTQAIMSVSKNDDSSFRFITSNPTIKSLEMLLARSIQLVRSLNELATLASQSGRNTARISKEQLRDIFLIAHLKALCNNPEASSDPIVNTSDDALKKEILDTELKISTNDSIKLVELSNIISNHIRNNEFDTLKNTLLTIQKYTEIPQRLSNNKLMAFICQKPIVRAIDNAGSLYKQLSPRIAQTEQEKFFLYQLWKPIDSIGGFSLTSDTFAYAIGESYNEIINIPFSQDTQNKLRLIFSRKASINDTATLTELLAAIESPLFSGLKRRLITKYGLQMSSYSSYKRSGLKWQSTEGNDNQVDSAQSIFHIIHVAPESKDQEQKDAQDQVKQDHADTLALASMKRSAGAINSVISAAVDTLRELDVAYQTITDGLSLKKNAQRSLALVENSLKHLSNLYRYLQDYMQTHRDIINNEPFNIEYSTSNNGLQLEDNLKIELLMCAYYDKIIESNDALFPNSKNIDKTWIKDKIALPFYQKLWELEEVAEGLLVKQDFKTTRDKLSWIKDFAEIIGHALRQDNSTKQTDNASLIGKDSNRVNGTLTANRSSRLNRQRNVNAVTNSQTGNQLASSEHQAQANSQTPLQSVNRSSRLNRQRNVNAVTNSQTGNQLASSEHQAQANSQMPLQSANRISPLNRQQQLNAATNTRTENLSDKTVTKALQNTSKTRNRVQRRRIESSQQDAIDFLAGRSSNSSKRTVNKRMVHNFDKN